MGGDAEDQRPRPSAGGAIADLYDRFAASLFRTAYAMLGSAADAGDAVHDVFLAVARARASWPAVTDWRAYLFTALRRAAARRAARRAPKPLPDHLAARPAASERDDALELALARLPPEQREVIALKIDGGLSFAELAAVVGCNPNTAGSRYRYALAKLRAELEREP